MESIKHNENYSKHFFKRRILKTWLHFVLAVLLFVVVQTPIGKVYPAYKYATCWFAWESVGNSNWFVFDILVLYLIVYVVMLVGRCLSKDKRGQRVVGAFRWVLVLIGTGVLFVFLYVAKRGQPWWINTLFVFPIGMVYSCYKDTIDKVLRNCKAYCLTVVGLITVFSIWYHRYGVDLYGVSSILFVLIFAVLATRVRLGNRVLDWLGTNAFAIYILQRLPMNVLAYYGYNENVVLFSVVSVVAALLLAAVFTWFIKVLDSKLFAAK